jgi:hypothetical protein
MLTIIFLFYTLFSYCISVISFHFSSIPKFTTKPIYSKATSNSIKISPRIQKIKDLYLTKKVMNDMTASEFALIVNLKTKEQTIDYDMLILRLDQNSNLLATRDQEGDRALLSKIKELKIGLTNKKNGNGNENELNDLVQESPKVESSSNSKESIPSLRIMVREDGSIDWEEAIASSRQVAKFGTELWERLNGKEETQEGLPSLSELFGQVPTTIPRNKEIEMLEAIVNATKKNLEGLENIRSEKRSLLKEAKKNTQTITAVELQELRSLDFKYKEQEKRLNLLNLDLDMEIICACLEQEVQVS